MAAAAAVANGSPLAVETSPGGKGNYKLHSKEKKSKKEYCGSELKKKKKKKKRKLAGGEAKPIARGRKKFGIFEDLALRLSKKLGPSQVFPQDEKEAAILLMALSYNYNGLLHG